MFYSYNADSATGYAYNISKKDKKYNTVYLVCEKTMRQRESVIHELNVIIHCLYNN